MIRYLPTGTPVIAMNKKSGNSLSFLFRLAKLFKGLGPAVIHTRTWGGIDGVFAARLAGIKTVVHGEHGWTIEDPYGLSLKRRHVRRLADMGVHCYTCVSRQLKDWLTAGIRVRKPITQIYNGIDAQTFRPPDIAEKALIRRALGISNVSPIIGVVGRLDPIKNHRCLFDAFQRLRPQFPKMQLLVIGDGPERKRLERAANEGIRFLGRREDIEDIFRALDIFVLPSRNEGISNTIMEAMATGLPAIAANVGGNPELIEDGVNGALFLSDEVENLSDKIRFYIQNPKIAQKHGVNARKTVESRFTVERMVSAYENVWRGTWLYHKGREKLG